MGYFQRPVRKEHTATDLRDDLLRTIAAKCILPIYYQNQLCYQVSMP